MLTYTTEALDSDLEITGPITVELFASSSASDQDWIVHLTRVHEDGKSWLMTDGLLKASHRQSHESPEAVSPGKVYRMEIEVWPTSQLLRRGQRLRVDVMNATFPKVEPCPYVSTNRVFHDREYPSSILLPVIPIDSGGVWAASE